MDKSHARARAIPDEKATKEPPPNSVPDELTVSDPQFLVER
jgi:hypothetical protein